MLQQYWAYYSADLLLNPASSIASSPWFPTVLCWVWSNSHSFDPLQLLYEDQWNLDRSANYHFSRHQSRSCPTFHQIGFQKHRQSHSSSAFSQLCVCNQRQSHFDLTMTAAVSALIFFQRICPNLASHGDSTLFSPLGAVSRTSLWISLPGSTASSCSLSSLSSLCALCSFSSLGFL
jgi:hypothetical protein